jgi:hypothetical protein
MAEKEIIQKWTEINKPIGEMLGYPECCIRAFCEQPPELLQNSAPTPDDDDRLTASYIDGAYTGFFPCITHAKKILSGEITLISLIDHDKRNNNEEYFIPPFPHANHL